MLKEYIKAGFGLTIGSQAFFFLAALFTIFFSGIGLYLYYTQNKEGTEINQELTVSQIVGISLGILGLLPWLGSVFGVFLRGFGLVFGKEVAKIILSGMKN